MNSFERKREREREKEKEIERKREREREREREKCYDDDERHMSQLRKYVSSASRQKGLTVYTNDW